MDGFIHFSDVEQVVAVANAAFSSQGDLVLLCVSTDRLGAPLKYESSDAGGESFPHLYGALNLVAVVAVVPFVEGDTASSFLLKYAAWVRSGSRIGVDTGPGRNWSPRDRDPIA